MQKLIISKDKLINLGVIDSTNNFAHEIIKSDESVEGTVILADFQTKGKGQKDNKWISAERKNLTFSFILKPSFLFADKHFYLSMTISSAVADFLDEKKLKNHIKWPNDVYIENGKIGGILIENSFLNNKLLHSVIGIGLNVNQTKFPSYLINPTSLIIETKKEHDRIAVFYELIDYLNKWLDILCQEEYKRIKKFYLLHLLAYMQEMAFKRSDKTEFRGKIEEIEDYGSIRIRNSYTNKLESFDFKEIEMILQNP